MRRAGLPATPGVTRLPLLPLGSDGVRRIPPRRSRPNAALRIPRGRLIVNEVKVGVYLASTSVRHPAPHCHTALRCHPTPVVILPFVVTLTEERFQRKRDPLDAYPTRAPIGTNSPPHSHNTAGMSPASRTGSASLSSSTLITGRLRI